jgi:hypothetical protein
MRTRHITVSKQQGMITELELVGAGFGAGEQYMLRYHKSASDSADAFDLDVTDLHSISWMGFRYRNDEVSVLLQRQGPSSAAA